jgi:hypothetical protein
MYWFNTGSTSVSLAFTSSRRIATTDTPWTTRVGGTYRKDQNEQKIVVGENSKELRNLPLLQKLSALQQSDFQSILTWEPQQLMVVVDHQLFV